MSLTSGLSEYHASQRPGWQLLDDMARLRTRLTYPASGVRRMRGEIVRLVGRTRDVAISFPLVERPVVSVVIPVFNNWALTRRCLASLCLTAPAALVEVLVVDDASTDGTRVGLEGIPGLRVLSNDANVGFTRAANRGARAARGAFTFFLNNDTVMAPGCIEALLDTMSDASVGAAGARLVYPSGRLQEVGAVIWNDGTGAQIGHGQSPLDFRFTCRRDVHYCSGAALMVRSDLLRALDYFDERFAPAYYEDTDLCFRLRAQGSRVVAEPAATVVHWEGMTHGTESRRAVRGAYTKSHQRNNRVKFAEKWAAELSNHAAPVRGRRLPG
ncbi:MAG TPA: glycosyltransferase family 2 protein [Candidatus Dormibacteraeota bacterium]|nr:glycosyltransferase family 2 protein [Candidatus Dormibacteraeota bacterium]